MNQSTGHDFDKTARIRPSAMHVATGTPIDQKAGGITFMPSQRWNILTFVVSLAALGFAIAVYFNTRNSNSADLGNMLNESLVLQRTIDKKVDGVSTGVGSVLENIGDMAANDKGMVSAMQDLSKVVNSGVKNINSTAADTRREINVAKDKLDKLRHSVAHIQQGLDAVASSQQQAPKGDEPVVKLTIEEEGSTN